MTVAMAGNTRNKLQLKFDDILKNEDKSINIVIPVNRCFDTIIDDDLISKNSLHGKVMNHIFRDNKFDSNSLNEEIQKQLKELAEREEIEPEQLDRSSKRSGNLARYPVGTIVEFKIEENSQETYYFVAISKLDKNLHATTTNEDYGLAMNKLLNFINSRSQGNLTKIPLIGSGKADLYQNEQEVLDFMVKFFKLNSQKVNCDIDIVVWEGSRDRVSLLS